MHVCIKALMCYLYLWKCKDLFLVLCGVTNQFITFNGPVMTLCTAMERKTGAESKQWWREGVTSSHNS